jgi:hypothetical protein
MSVQMMSAQIMPYEMTFHPRPYVDAQWSALSKQRAKKNAARNEAASLNFALYFQYNMLQMVDGTDLLEIYHPR